MRGWLIGPRLEEGFGGWWNPRQKKVGIGWLIITMPQSFQPLKKLGFPVIICPYGVEVFAILYDAESVVAIITFEFGYSLVIYCVNTLTLAVSGEVINVINVFGIFVVFAADCDCDIADSVLVCSDWKAPRTPLLTCPGIAVI